MRFFKTVVIFIAFAVTSSLSYPLETEEIGPVPVVAPDGSNENLLDASIDMPNTAVHAGFVRGNCLRDIEERMCALINNYRETNGLAKLPYSKALSTVAQWHACTFESITIVICRAGT